MFTIICVRYWSFYIKKNTPIKKQQKVSRFKLKKNNGCRIILMLSIFILAYNPAYINVTLINAIYCFYLQDVQIMFLRHGFVLHVIFSMLNKLI